MPPDHAEKILFRFVRELPRLPSAADLGIATGGVRPWPHQLRVIRRVVERFPQSYLFSDEVGLGKTIEAALALRCLWLTGRVRRALVLVPRALLRQWQEELHEKAMMEVARFEGGQFFDVRDRPLSPRREARNPWDRHDLILASTQLARGPARRRELLEAEKWDLVIVDEAHHARRRSPQGPYRPNRLLELLDGSGEPLGGEKVGGEGSLEAQGLRHRARALYLLSATPMQIHPLEVWDLLRLLGLGGKWAAEERAFLDYFEELRRPFRERNWRLLLDLACHDGTDPPDILGRFPAARWSQKGGLEKVAWPKAEEAKEIDAWLRRATPIGDFVWRHTRSLLKRYKEEGLIEAGVPERRPKNIWVELSPRQRRLYGRIEAYLSEFYQRYEAKRTGLGFVMTVYRRRLTSSFAAVRLSLERRREYLLGRRSGLGAQGGEWETAIAGHQQDLDLDSWALEGRSGEAQAEMTGEGELPAPSVFSRDELEYLDAILEEIGKLGREPKLDRLEADLRRFLKRRDRVLVFTQYLDTLDQLRDALRSTYEVASYSGRGGEVWRQGGWRRAEKEDLKTAFAAGEIEVLLCTEAASEGLNLQTCGVLINYDMPWNPMRVEQRIGRIDRIGQVHRRLWIRNYFYAETVEASIYQRLGDRIDWFKAILGELQPILHGVGEAVQRLALTPESRRRRRLEEALAELNQKMDALPPDPLSIQPDEMPRLSAAPIREPLSASSLEKLFLNSRIFGDAFVATDEVGVFRLDIDGRDRLITFTPKIFAQRPYSLQLVSWGTPLFESLLETIEEPATVDEPAGLGLYASNNPAPVAVFAAPDGDGEIREIADLDSLRDFLRRPVGRWSGAQEASAASFFSGQRRRVLRGFQEVEAGRRRAEKSALRSEAGELLVQAATLELVAARNPGLFDPSIPFGWGEEAILAQGRRGGPFLRLLEIAAPGLEAREDSVQAGDLVGLSPEHLARRSVEAERRAQRIVGRWTRVQVADEAARRLVTDRSTGLLERTYFQLCEGVTESIYVEAGDLEPFRNGLPVLGDIAEAASTLTEAWLAGRNPLREAAEDPGRYSWVRSSDRVTPGPDLFVATLSGHAMEPRVPDGSHILFRVDPSPPRDGQMVLVDGVEDPEVGGDAVLREWRLEKKRGNSPRLRLEALAPGFPPIILDEPGESGLRIVARFLDVIE